MFGINFKRDNNINHDDVYTECTKQGNQISITANMITQCLKSPFSLYCNYHVDASEKDVIPDEYLQKLAVQGIQHEQDVIEKTMPDADKIEVETPEKGFELALLDMSKGIGGISGSPLFYLPENIYGFTDQIIRNDKQKSRFGNYHYVVKEIKLAKNINKFHIFQTAFYNYMLGKIQNYTPKEFYIINNKQEEIPFQYDDYADKLFDIMAQTREIISGDMVPTPTFDSCKYPWSNYCNQKALESHDISLLSGVGVTTKQDLLNEGIKDLNNIIATGVDGLINIKGVGKITAEKHVMNAKAMLSGEAIRKKTVEIPQGYIDIFFDFEGIDTMSKIMFIDDNNENTDIDNYLIGLTINEKYMSFVAENKDEKTMIQEFVAYCKTLNNYKLYHWGHYEKTHLKKAFNKYDILEEDQKIILDSLVDLSPIATKSFAFPVPGTSLKTIAKWMGFVWEHDINVGALNSVDLYKDYLDNDNMESLQLIKDYNRDDCNATAMIKDWLIKNQ